MTLLNLILLLVIKPLALMGFGWWQFKSNYMAAASSRHLGLLLVFTLIPLSLLLNATPLTSIPGVSLRISLGRDIDHWLAMPSGHWLQYPATQWLLGIYLLGVLWILFYLALGMVSLRSREKCAASDRDLQRIADELCATLKLRRRVRVHICENLDMPQVWGILRVTVFIPTAMIHWPQEKLKLILLHELGHVARYDWLSHILVRCICALYWPIPHVWRLARTLENMSESACDDWVLTTRHKSADYAQLLLSLTKSLQRQDPLPAAAITGGSAHYQRLMALLDAARDRDRIDRGELVRALIVAILVLLPLSLLQAAVQPPDTLQPTLDPIATIPLSAIQHPFDHSNTDENFSPLPQRQPIQFPPSTGRPPEEELLVMGLTPPTRLTADAIDSELSQTDISSKNAVREYLALAQEVVIQGYLPIRTITPLYPKRAILRGIEGRVRVQFSIDVAGKPFDMRIVYAQPKGIFEQTVLKAVAEFRFRPHTINGRPVSVSGIGEEFVFQLTSKDLDKKRKKVISSGPTEIAHIKP